MPNYVVEPSDATLHGTFSRDLEPVLTILPGDSVRFRTLDAGWGFVPSPGAPREKYPRPQTPANGGHALCGPIHVEGARPGMTLEIRINDLRPATFGWNSGGGWPNWQNQRLGIADPPEVMVDWVIDHTRRFATTTIRDQHLTVPIHPFMGVLGMPPAEPGIHATFPPRATGGNIDCKELVQGSSLFLPIAVDGGLFSVGDGHAAQGDGEVCGMAIECPMDVVDLSFFLHEDMHLTMPRANTPTGWITFGFNEDLNDATVSALDGMLTLLGERYGLNRREAMAVASVVVDLRITQIVNGVKGVHAVLPHGALR